MMWLCLKHHILRICIRKEKVVYNNTNQALSATSIEEHILEPSRIIIPKFALALGLFF